MKYLSPIISAALAGNIKPGTLTSTCQLNGDVVVEFDYEPVEQALDFAFVGASNSTTCGHGTGQVTLTNTDSIKGRWRIDYNADSCGYVGDFMSKTTTLSFSEGHRSTVDSTFIAMKRQFVDVICRYETVQTVSYNFSVNKTLEEYDATATSTGGLVFDLQAYSNPERTIDLENMSELYSGTPVYLTLSAQVAPELLPRLSFAPHKCIFRKTGESDQSYTLFESSVNGCDQQFPELGFSLDFNADDRTWDISYNLFTFGEDVASTYYIDCEIYACYTDDNKELCRAVAEQCDGGYADNYELWQPVPSVHVSTSAMTWEDAKIYCEDLQYDMFYTRSAFAVPTNSDQQAAFSEALSGITNNPGWLGIKTHYENDDLPNWSGDGEIVSFENFCSDEPIVYHIRQERCVATNDNCWTHNNCNELHRAICIYYE